MDTIPSGTIPDSWNNVILSMLHKKGNINDPNNYRGIALVNCKIKVFTQIIHDRLMAWAVKNNKILKEQAGFLKSQGCQDNVFTLSAAIRIHLR